MEQGIGDFLSQIPISFILAPIFFGVLYIAAMFVVFRRAAERRRRKREAQQADPMGQTVGALGMGGMMPAAAGAYGNIALPTTPSPRPLATSITPLPPMPDVPEPDLDLLTQGLLDEAERLSTLSGTSSGTSSGTLPSTPSITPGVVQAAPMPAESAVPAASATSAASANAPLNAVEVMRIWRDVDDGGLIIQMGDQRYRSVGEIQSPDLVRRLTTIVRELSGMVGAPVPTVVPPPGVIRSLNPAPAPITPLPSAESSKTPGIIGRALGRSAPPKKEETQPAGIFAAVEEFLQGRLANTPAFAQRSLHIRPSLDHGIKIEVDGKFYDSIDSVADADVRDFLFTIMREWEARQ